MIPAEQQSRFKIRCMDFEGMDAVKEAEGQEDLSGADAVVGTVDLKLPNVPFISVDEFVVGDGMARLSEMIQGQAETVCETKDEAVMDEKLLTGTLEQLLYFLNPKKMAGQAMES